MADVFISYKSTRRKAARHLEQILIRYGYSVWFDHALVRGVDYEAQIQREVEAAKAVIVLWCALSVESEAVRSEANLAKRKGKQVPLKIEACELPLFSTLTQFIDVIGATCAPRDGSFDALLDDVERLVGRPPQADLKALREYETTWRAMGSFTLAEFPLEAVTAPEVVLSLAGAPVHVAPGIPTGSAEREWRTHDLDRCTDPGLLKAFAAKYDGADPLWAYKARQLAAGYEAAEQLRQKELGYQREGRIRIDAAVCSNDRANWFKPGNGQTEWFQDLDAGPEMVVVPAGSFMMGSPKSEVRWDGYDGREEPQHSVAIGKPFAVGKYAVTRGQFAAFVKATNRQMPDKLWTYELEAGKWEAKERAGRSWRNPGFAQDDSHPVVGVSWEDAQAYCRWLSKASGATYHLPSESEWEYVCRAGKTEPFWWGPEISVDQANYDGNYVYGKGRKGDYRKGTVSAQSFAPNPWGLYQVHGNVWEWCEDAWHIDYNGNPPTDGSVWQNGDPSLRVLRGGSWNSYPKVLRSAFRLWFDPTLRFNAVGFRLARTL